MGDRISVPAQGASVASTPSTFGSAGGSARELSPPAGRPIAPPLFSPVGDAQPSSDTRAAFLDFFEQRDAIKSGLYRKIVFSSFLAVIVSIVLIIFGTILWLGFVSDSNVVYFGSFCHLSGGLLLSLGVCASSTVPVEDFCFDKQLASRPVLRRSVLCIIGGSGVIMGSAGLSIFPYFPGALLALSGVSCLYELCFTSPLRLTLKMSAYGVSLVLLVTQVMFIVGVNPSGLSVNLFLRGPQFAEFVANMLQNQATAAPIMTTCAVVCSILMLGAVVFWLRMTKDQSGTTLLYVAMYCGLLTFGNVCCCLAILASVSSVFSAALVVQIGCGGSAGLCLLPPLLTLLVGPRRVFTLLARYFELDISRLQKDGALMAELVASSKVVDTESQVHWLLRRKEKPSLKSSNSNHVMRNFWVRGRIFNIEEGPDGTVLHLRVCMREDKDASWVRYSVIQSRPSPPPPSFPPPPSSLPTHSLYYFPTAPYSLPHHPTLRYQSSFFVGPLLTTHGLHVVDASLPSEKEFNSWLEETFNSTLLPVQPIPKECAAIVKVTIKAKGTRNDLLSWATDHFRAFSWEKFHDKLLFESPRLLVEKVDQVSCSASCQSSHYFPHTLIYLLPFFLPSTLASLRTALLPSLLHESCLVRTRK